eukprot:TRINITY_DN20887_c0_g1_i1.p1 TRINITY_DN20887_c0_g1~~TRINITY_DN20887_c0_g1_i1.p1  ORF type:complete len:106 (-),score=14.66 TRINITY_DN20887_c0_g1_i1:310-627(-)
MGHCQLPSRTMTRRSSNKLEVKELHSQNKSISMFFPIPTKQKPRKHVVQLSFPFSKILQEKPDFFVFSLVIKKELIQLESLISCWFLSKHEPATTGGICLDFGHE